jgi:HEPN domain-containing protein
MTMTDKEKSLKRFKEWENYALEDEQIIQLALEEKGPPNQICLHDQQMAEKYLKGYLAFQKHMPIKTHNLEELILECAKYDDSFIELKKDAVKLNDFYIEARYPGDIEEFSIQDAKEGYESAISIRDFVSGKIKA